MRKNILKTIGQITMGKLGMDVKREEVKVEDIKPVFLTVNDVVINKGTINDIDIPSWV